MGRINKEDRRQTAVYGDMRRESRAMWNENNDCVVMAIALACNIPYSAVHQALNAQGRKNGKGTWGYQWTKALKELGIETEIVKPSDFIKQYPKGHRDKLKNVTTHHMDRFPNVWKDGHNYLLHTRQHMGAVVDGVNHDWTKGRACRVDMIYRIKNPRGES